MQPSSQCDVCKHRRGENKCDAFSEIPALVFMNIEDHRDTVRGDNGVKWEAAQETSVHPMDPDFSQLVMPVDPMR